MCLSCGMTKGRGDSFLPVIYQSAVVSGCSGVSSRTRRLCDPLLLREDESRTVYEGGGGGKLGQAD